MMGSTVPCIILVCLLCVLACGDRIADGMERGRCYGNGTCSDGLICLSELCVDPAKRVPNAARRAADEAQRQPQQAEQLAQQAVKDAQEAQDRVGAMDREFRDLSKRLGDAQTAFNAAKTEADRRAAQAKLDELRQQKLEMERRIQASKDAAATAERRKGVHLSKECLENPLAKGCS